MKPAISVILSVYNGEAYLAEAIDSVCRQTFSDWELIVINDCSTDSTADILADFAAKDPRVKVHTNAVNLRLPTSLNKAISLSEGKYIARMDADDICLPDRLEKQYAFMESHSDVALSSCRFLTLKNGVYAPGGAGGRRDNEALRAMLLVSNPILHPGVIAKAEVMKSLLYDTSRTCTEDLELWTRMAAAGHKMQIQDAYLLIYRLHDKQITGTTLARQHTEVTHIQQTYYAAVAQQPDAAMQDFYISGIYFREQADIHRFLTYAKWLKRVTAEKVDRHAVAYALMEILAEYKRCGVSKAHVLRGMLSFSPLFVVRELLRRKREAKHDIAQCVAVAEQLGLTRTGGTDAFPLFQSL